MGKYPKPVHSIAEDAEEPLILVVDDDVTVRELVERHLGRAFVLTAQAHNRLGLTEALDPATRPYYDRPYQVLDAGRFAAALRRVITDPEVPPLPPHIRFEQAEGLAKSLLKGETSRRAIIAESIKGKLAEFTTR